jgi:hypothetical protein
MAFSYGDVIVTDSGASISLAAIIGILIAVLCLKGKIAENFKIPSAFIVATVLFVIIILVEKILLPAKFTCLTCMISCGIDELSFKRIYNRLEILMPEKSKIYKHFGFYFCKSEKLGEFTNVQD